MNIKECVENFLRKYDLYYDKIDLDVCCKDFIMEMENGLSGRNSSILMLPTYIAVDNNVPNDETVIVMDAGGTNFRVATLEFDINNQAVIEDFQVYKMPGTQGEITKEEFFETVADYLMPVINKSNKIGFCFSYATEALPNKDGKLIRFSKEVKIKGLQGEKICEGISVALKNKGIQEEKSFVLLNDTVATMLGGVMACPERSFSDYIGFILGTGTNTCYIEKNANIAKIKPNSDTVNLNDSMAINMESGGYANAPRSIIDEKFDESTVNPASQKFEKMISGAYFGTLVYNVIKYAIKEKLFSDKFESDFNKLSDLSMKNLDDFLYYPESDNILANCVKGSNHDRLTLYYILDAIFERAAKLVCINIASILIKNNSSTDPTKPACVTAEGTTFYKSKLFKTKLDFYVRSYINDELGYYCEFIKVDNATLIGTAVAGLTNLK